MPAPPTAAPLITLLTDFGAEDAFAGVMKGVIAKIAPEARVVDLTHAVPAQDIRAGAFQLLAAYRYFPEGTVHLAVVDPGVGTGRRIVAARTRGHTFVGPDNGLLRWAVDDAGGALEAVVVERPEYRLPCVSATFHGRDIMAPAAAHLATGLRLAALGPPAGPLAGEPFPQPAPVVGGLAGVVLHVDHFGNCITNLPPAAPPATVCLDGARARLVQTYHDGAPGELVALVSSSGLLEVAVRGASAARLTGATAGSVVRLVSAGGAATGRAAGTPCSRSGSA
jgi:S-adenosylmethionine hydrolase